MPNGTAAHGDAEHPGGHSGPELQRTGKLVKTCKILSILTGALPKESNSKKNSNNGLVLFQMTGLACDYYFFKAFFPVLCTIQLKRMICANL